MFEAFSRDLLSEGNGIRFQARGASMSPTIRDGEIVHVRPVAVASLREGDIVLVRSPRQFRLHRLIMADAERNVFITRGDCGLEDDPAVCGAEILGAAVTKEVRVGRKIVRARLAGFGGRVVQTVARVQLIFEKLVRAGPGP